VLGLGMGKGSKKSVEPMENNAKHEKSGKITMKMKIAVKVIENLT